MLLVAIIAVILGRSIHFAKLARTHERERMKYFSSDLDVYLLMTPAPRGFPSHPDSGHPISRAVVPLQAYVAYHIALEAKYDRASRRPWLPVAPDPPQPPEPSRAQWNLYRTLLNDP